MEDLGYSLAVDCYLEDCKGRGVIPDQPSESESETDLWGWMLRNVNGPLAYVTHGAMVLAPNEREKEERFSRALLAPYREAWTPVVEEVLDRYPDRKDWTEAFGDLISRCKADGIDVPMPVGSMLLLAAEIQDVRDSG